MPSKKYRPIVMNRNKAPGRTYSVLKKAVLITALLALIEVIILVVIHFKNAKKPIALKQEKSTVIPKVPVHDTSKTVAVIPPQVAAENRQKDTVLKKDTVAIIKPVAKETQRVEPKPVADTATSNKIKPKAIKARKVTDEEMFQILNEVRMEKLKANNPANCISIQIVNISNAENGSMIASYLRKNGYIISGREVTDGNRKGIHVDAAGPCLKLSIGSL